MADQTIDKVQLELKATSQGATEVISGLVTQLNALKSVLSSLDTSKLKTATQGATKVSIDTSGLTKSEKEVRTSIDNIKKDLAGLKAIKDLGISGDKSSLISAQRKLATIQSDANKLAETFKQAGDNRSSVNIGSDMLQGFRTELADLQSLLNKSKSEIDSAVAVMNSKKIKINTGNSKKDLDSLGAKAKKVAGNLLMLSGKTIATSFKNLGSGIGKIRTGLSDIGNRFSRFANTGFMKILRYGFGIRSLYVLFRRLKEAIKDSFGALQSSGAMFETTRANITALKNSLQTLKFQFGAAFEPIFNAIAPALQTLINYLVTVMNVISAFTAKLMGRSTYSKVSAVLTKTGSAAGGAAKNVKELNHQLQGFDELNNLTLDPGNSGGGGGGGGGGSDGAMYEAANVDDALGDFAQELAKKIEEGDWFGLGRTISDKLSEVLESIPWDSIYEKARNFGTGLAEFLNGLITPRLFGDVASTLASALNTAFYFLNSFGKEFDWENFGNSIATAINDFFETADFAEWGDTVHTYVAGILDAGIELLKSTDFEAIGQKLADFLNGLQIADLASKLYDFALTLGGAIAESLKSLWDNSSVQTKIGAAIVGLIAVGKLTGLSSALATQIGKFLVNNPITVGKAALVVAAAIVGWKIGTKIYESASGHEVEQGFIEQIQDIWDGFTKDKVSFNLLDFIEFSVEDADGWYGTYRDWVYDLVDAISRDFNILKTSVKTAWQSIWYGEGTGVQKGYNGAPSEAYAFINAHQTSEFDKMGANLWNGIFNGFENAMKYTNPLVGQFVWLKQYIQQKWGDTFEEHSPARAMYPLGKNLWLGIYNGFKEAMEKFSLGDLINSLALTFLGTGTVKTGSTAQGKFNSPSTVDKTHSKTGQKVTINTQYTGDIKGKNGLKDAVAYWTQLMDGITDKDSSLETSMLGAFTSVEQVGEGAENFRNLDRDFRSKNATYTTNMGGQITTKEQIDSVRTQYENLYNAWNSKASRFDVNTGGQLDKFGTLDTWKTKFTNLFNSWIGKSATMSANVGGQMNKIGDTDTWVGKIKNLINNWVGKTANFNAGFNQTQGTIAGYADQIQRLAGSWNSKSADFTLNASFNADNINDIADRLVNRIKKGLTGTTKVQFGANGGIFTSSGKHNIPQYAGGTLNAGSMFIAGEAGPEIVGEINGRTEVLNRSQIAATIKAATVSGMRLFRGSQMVRPPELDNQSASMSAYGYEMKSQMAANNEAIFEQNRLLQEQNTLLREIANKELTVSTKDVFDATKKEANIYYERTGNSPFLY